MSLEIFRHSAAITSYVLHQSDVFVKFQARIFVLWVFVSVFFFLSLLMNQNIKILAMGLGPTALMSFKILTFSISCDLHPQWWFSGVLEEFSAI